MQLKFNLSSTGKANDGGKFQYGQRSHRFLVVALPWLAIVFGVWQCGICTKCCIELNWTGNLIISIIRWSCFDWVDATIGNEVFVVDGSRPVPPERQCRCAVHKPFQWSMNWVRMHYSATVNCQLTDVWSIIGRKVRVRWRPSTSWSDQPMMPANSSPRLRRFG